MKEALSGKLLISILAGVTVKQLTGLVDPSTKVVRAMPNTPCKVSVPCKRALSQSSCIFVIDSRGHDGRELNTRLPRLRTRS